LTRPLSFRDDTEGSQSSASDLDVAAPVRRRRSGPAFLGAGRMADVPQAVLTDLYLRAGALPVGRPSRSTVWRACTDTDPRALTGEDDDRRTPTSSRRASVPGSTSTR
jgi:hypothetical protein